MNLHSSLDGKRIYKDVASNRDEGRILRMSTVLIVYDSRTGNTERAAELMAEGVREVEGVKCIVKRVDDASLDDLLNADGIIIGSPTYYGLMSAKIKRLIDDSVEIHGRLEGKIGAAFTSSGGNSSRAETTIPSILKAFLIHGIIIQGDPHSQHYGLAVIGAPNERD
ncbi:flavodoxin family protein [Candidatus Bathyarchaeota archaeon]|nr:MAG: flavodoxin family protein [Candidatus Bathyarchaeota archaeon]